jgi:uncharacterized repeat protein (TIGR02543 family)
MIMLSHSSYSKNLGKNFNSKLNLYDGNRVLAVFVTLLLMVALLPVFFFPVVVADVSDEVFQLEVTVAAGSLDFCIPVSSFLNADNNIVYNWDIDWGDGVASLDVTGTGSQNSAGISHTYAAADTYTITITPAGSEEAWFAAFGFNAGTAGANAQANKDKVTKILSPLTPLMTRTTAQLASGTAPDYEWFRTFYSCTNLAMGSAFTFSPQWATITTVGDYFAYSMFESCSSSLFTMNSVFNLPLGITTVGTSFASSMFYHCGGDAFTMGDVFNLPPGIETVGDFFAYNMFEGCSGDKFIMNSGFNLPQSITGTVGIDFAMGMFSGCGGDNFCMNDVFNLPPGIKTAGNSFASNMFDGCGGDAFTMNDVFNLPPGIETVGSYFACQMFMDCGGDAFTMNDVFNLPQSITGTVGDGFALGMFRGCGGDNFCMNDVFNLPQSITTVGNYFTYGMFHFCSGGGFIVNSVFKFPVLDSTNLNKLYVFYQTFNSLGAAPVQGRTATSIINGNDVPAGYKGTFFGSDCFVDRVYIHENWGGDGELIKVCYEPGLMGTWLVGSDTHFVQWRDPLPAFVVDVATEHQSGYTFNGWDNGTAVFGVNDPLPVTVTFPVTFTALWRADVVDLFIVVYDGNGASGGVAPVDNNGYAAGSLVTVLGQGGLVRSGYVFLGWSTDPLDTAAMFTAGSTFVMAGEDVRLYAVWALAVYTVSFEPGAHGTFASKVVGGLHYGDATPAAPTITGEVGWTFNGWLPTLSATVTNTTTYTAQWTQTTSPSPSPSPSPSASATSVPTSSSPAAAISTVAPTVTSPPTSTVAPSGTVDPRVDVVDRWSVVNLLLAVLGVVLAVLAGLYVLLSRRGDIGQGGPSVGRGGFLWLLVCVVLAVVGLVVFLVTEDQSLSFGWVTDKWTILNVVILIIEAIAVWLCIKTAMVGNE